MNVLASLYHFLRIVGSQNPNLDALLKANSETKFLTVVEGELQRSFGAMEAGAKHYSVLDEPGLSGLLVDLLRAAGFDATAETNHKGHVDVVVACTWGRGWVFLGECKIYNGYKYHVKGCNQVLGYCTGRQSRVFVIAFFKQRNMYTKLNALLSEFNQHRPLAQIGPGSNCRFKGSFVTEHLHSSSGANVQVVHYGVNLYVGSNTN